MHTSNLFQTRDYLKIMSIDAGSVQSVVSSALKEYEEDTLIIEDIVEFPDRFRSGEKCNKSIQVNIESLKHRLNSITVSKLVRDVIKCESKKFLRGLETESEVTEEIGEDLINDLVKTISGHNTPRHLYLPDNPEYRIRMGEHGLDEQIALPKEVPIHWFNPEIVDTDEGFLLTSGVYVNQRRQGKTPVIANNLDSELSKDNSKNRLRTYLRRVRGGKVEMEFMTKFTQPKTIDDRSKIVTLELPEIEI